MATEKIRVGYLVNYFVPAGLENFVLTLLNHLDRDRFEPFLYVLHFSDPEFCARVRDDVPIFHLNRQSGRDFKALWHLSRKIKSDGIQILQIHNWSTFLEGVIIKLFYPRIKLVHVQQGMEYELTLKATPLKRRIRKILRHLFMPLVTVAVGCSRQAREFLKREWGARRTILIYNSVDTEKFKGEVTPESRIDTDGYFTVCTVGRIVPVKNFLCLFKAIHLLKDRIPRLRLYHIGANPAKGQRYDGELIDYIKRHQLNDHIIFLGPRNDLPTLLGNFDVFALTSFSEGLSFSLLEAQASGLPAVATRVGGNPEVVRDGVNGYLVPSDDEQAVADAIYKLYADAEKRKEMGKKAREIVKQYFSVDVMVEQYQTLYSLIASGKDISSVFNMQD
ncbi:MAG: glycosyltransferase [Calditrichaeota bacterium]|nr:glycosyltransferase [Calditrichota bacterium]